MLPRLAVANILIPIAVLIFATGFFPYKPFIPGLASHDDFRAKHGEPPKAQFDKLVFMVVDALRSDFVFSSASGFSYTQKIIRDGDAIPFTAYATPPTVTMPRVKAITSGSTPSFLDAILNFAESDTTSTLASIDSWLAQIKANKRNGEGRINMFGDDTWLKVFPDMFHRTDGTTSFFVSDFTEVDRNVTRHVPPELRKDDWDAMVMHYLGLDHIGHKAGPTSPNMIPKHMEMDQVVRSIFAGMSKLPHLNETLFILCGDHGMTDAGNHGGAGPGETSTALVFMSPKLRQLSPSGRKCPVTPQGGQYEFYKVVDQSDMAPTISSLLGLPVPRNNLGVILPEFLGLWKDPNEQLQLLLRNGLQILGIVKAAFPGVDYDDVTDLTVCEDGNSDADRLACSWKKSLILAADFETGESTEVRPTLNALFSWCKEAQEIMSGAASNYDVPRMLLGTAIQAFSFGLALSSHLSTSRVNAVDSASILVIVASYGGMMFASSYVEEEQHFWYWIGAAWLFLISARSFQNAGPSSKPAKAFSVFALHLTYWTLAICHRVITRWNQTGQKHAGAPDIVNSVFNPHPFYMWCTIGATYLAVTLNAGYHLGRSLNLGSVVGPVVGFILSLGVAVPSISIKVAFTASDAPELFWWMTGEQVLELQKLPLVLLARVTFTGILALFALAFVIKQASAWSLQRRRRSFLATTHALFTLLLLTQSRPANTPLFFLLLLQYWALQYLDLTPSQLSITGLILGHVAFFALGNSNAISSIDLSNAYNGVSGYNIVAVGILLFVGNWAGPIFWSLAVLALAAPKNAKTVKNGAKRSKEEPRMAEKHAYMQHASIQTLFFTGVTLAVMLACTAMRTHLFVWTVFSPKYLFAMAWAVGFHVLVTAGVTRGLWELGG